jgi:hypothetical protein
MLLISQALSALNDMQDMPCGKIGTYGDAGMEHKT